MSLALSSSWYWPIRTNSKFGRSLVPRCLRRDSRYSGPFFKRKLHSTPTRSQQATNQNYAAARRGLADPLGRKPIRSNCTLDLMLHGHPAFWPIQEGCLKRQLHNPLFQGKTHTTRTNQNMLGNIVSTTRHNQRDTQMSCNDGTEICAWKCKIGMHNVGLESFRQFPQF